VPWPLALIRARPVQTDGMEADAALSHPSAADADEFIAAARASRSLLVPWVDPADTPERFAAYLRRAASEDHACFLVRHRACGALVGFVNINSIVRGSFQSGYLGYAGFAAHAGRGLMTAGVRSVIETAFADLGLHRLEANIQPGNERSIALVRRLGFRREGYSPHYLMLDGQWRDHQRWAIVAGELATSSGGTGHPARPHRQQLAAWHEPARSPFPGCEGGRPGRQMAMTDRQAMSADSALIHGGTLRGYGDPVVPPPVLASIFASWGDPADSPAYARNSNPTWTAVEQALGSIEQADAVVFSSGQAASMALMLALARGRDRILLPRDGYYNARLLAAELRPHGAEAILVDLQDLAEVGRELDRGRAVLWAESPTNPLLRVVDLAALGRLAAAAAAPMIVDNTVATGLLQQPLELGAVASLCSLTKSASGHSDLIMGVVLTRDADLLTRLRNWRTLGGGIAGPVESWLALRGLKTLPLRIERQSSTALAIAEYLAGHPRVTAVHYPGTNEETLSVARKQMPRGFGPLLSFELDGDAGDAEAVVAAARLIVPATSFGGVESTWERRGRWLGEVAPGSLIRLSAGLEPAAELIDDLERSLQAVATRRPA
jgi:cystathionine beta-lyase/cystathionine gamma-synthase/RimJ/RimL family protein N-acetyltransferase